MIIINQEKCIGCGSCSRDCFPGAIEQENKKAVLKNPANCISCGHCIALCPVEAISAPDLDMASIHNDFPEKDPEGLLKKMQARRSCRHYTWEKVSEGDLALLLEAARACPTAKNLQATRYIAVTEKIDAILDAALDGLGKVGEIQLKTATAPDERRRAENFLRWAETRKEDKSFDPLFFHAPLLLIFVAEKENCNDACAAAAYTELMAAELGLGCLYSGYFTACAAGSPEIRALLGLDDKEAVCRCLVLGHKDIRFLRTAPRKPYRLERM